MAFACCDYCYQEYINADGTLQMDFIKFNFGESAQVVQEPRTDEFALLAAKMNGTPVGNDTFVIVGAVKQKLCMCECHKAGVNVMH